MNRLLSLLYALSFAMLALAAPASSAGTVESAEATANEESGQDDRKLCEQKERAYVALQACSRLVMGPDVDAAEKVRIIERRAHASLVLFYFGEAAEDFTLVLDAEPDNLNALTGRAEALSENGAFAKSAEDWAHIAAARTDDIAARIHLGKNHYFAGAYAKAVAAYEDAVKLDGKNAAAYVGLARAYDMLDSRKKSDESIATALKLNPINTAALMARGEIAERRGDTKVAIESYMASLRANGMQIKPRHALQRLGIETPP
jgi:tetratricopeptide (TPR) repeat protein